MKRAAITGIAGQDGTYLARGLLRRGYEVHGLLQFPFDREEPVLRRRYPADEFHAVRWMTGSLEDPFSLVRFLKAARPDEIYHLAGLTDSRQSFLVPEESVLSITLGTLRLLEAARELCPNARLFLASSAEVFGVPAETPQSETTLKQPATPYGIAKLAADQFGRLHREKYGQFVTVGMLYNHESPLRPPNYLSRRLSLGVAAIKRGEAKELQLGDLSAERDWSDARDVVQAMWLSLQAAQPDDFVFASGTPKRVEEFVATAFRAAGLDWREFVRTTPRTDAQQQVTLGLCGNPHKAETELGWKRQWSFDAMVADLVQAELENRSELERANPAATPLPL
ncbi:MAG TPA: GDP-mannose 4,6-dehydratase [Verrucomicrobiota bacterium]|nr:GDP-mannose 4,6-dehydratase [Verrucomicrobiota bacterium]HQB16330.1 GDP-mannose 4,6-dehydratase [Verrucomicrobiota bacterium]